MRGAFPITLPHSGFSPAELILGIEHTPSRPLETRNPLLPRPLLIHPHRATTQTIERIIQRIPRQILIVDRQTTPSLGKIGPRIHQGSRRHVPLRGQTRHLGTCRALSRTIFRGRNSFAVATDQCCPGHLIGLFESVVRPRDLILGVEHTPGRALQLRDPPLPRTLLIHPHRATTQAVERIIQRLPRQILIVDRQTTASLREIGSRVRQLALRRIPLGGQVLQVGTGGSLDEVAEGGDVVGALDHLGAQFGLHLGELGGSQSLVLVEFAVAVDLVDLGPPLGARVGQVDADQAREVPACAAVGAGRKVGAAVQHAEAAGSLGEMGDVADDVEQMPDGLVVHRELDIRHAGIDRLIAVGARVEHIHGGERVGVVGERVDQVRVQIRPLR
ncbi:hypothetical protein NG2371_05288 [Nocardia gamkensis]|nr:hypothetical protein [Nocardia gamkensis]